ncbi:MAG: bifunctional folylpolyglutamate synthase/dihydrofolate synthase [Bacteroidia bacterium]|nr:bifunctional folylpolyglutamate synthase/dihydrofolate synthase [Bacteroidia bacterium]
MTYRQTLEYLYSRLPMFQRVGAAAYKADLSNTLAICEALNHPEQKFKSIHIAGTNGKGSTSHLIAAVLQAAGYKTGLYTSPHLKDFRERIRINGRMIPRARVIRFVEESKTAFEQIEPSFFEWTVGLAFDYFAREKVDIAVIETGLGGRLDSTNVITPLASVITNISWDHANLLGDTLTKIAGEKAGIIKHHIPVIIGETQPEVKAVFEKKSRSEKSPLVFADTVYKLRNVTQSRRLPLQLVCDVAKGRQTVLQGLRCALPGLYQQKNMVTVLCALDSLRTQGFRIPETAVRKGFAKVTSLTGLQGRWQVIGHKPLTIADTGHNEAGIKEVLRQIKATPHAQLHIVFGMVNDKDVNKVLKLLPQKAVYYFCAARLPRALAARELQSAAREFGLHGKVYRSVKQAVSAARKAANAHDLVYVGGSTFVVAEAI